MNNSRKTFLVTLFGFLVPPCVATANHAATEQKDALIAVYDSRYLAGGRAYDSLDALEAAVRAARPATLLVVACTPGAARAWLAAVPRFEDIPMHLDVAADTSSSCPAVPLPATSMAAASMDADPEVQRFWNQRMP